MGEKKNKGFIYKAENLKTRQIYIGATTDSIEIRIKDHFSKAKRGKGHKFQNAIATYGPEAFKFNQIDVANSIDELAEKEKMYIIEFNAKENGYNIDSGGGIQKTVYKYDLSGILVAKFDCLDAAAKTIDSTKQHISRACLSTNKTYKKFQWSYHYQEPFEANLDRRKRNVLQFSLDGKLIKEFNSVADASKQTGVSKSCIARVCRKERERSGGFIWIYNVKPNKL